MRQKEGSRILQKKPRTEHKSKCLRQAPPCVRKKKNLSLAKSPLIAGLYVVFATQKSAASRCFRHLIELCAPLIMDAAL